MGHCSLQAVKSVLVRKSKKDHQARNRIQCQIKPDYSPLTQAIVIEFCLHRLCQVPNPSSPPDYPLPSKLLDGLLFFLLRLIFGTTSMPSV